jgi:sodium/potassium/calcium exchanger 6
VAADENGWRPLSRGEDANILQPSPVALPEVTTLDEYMVRDEPVNQEAATISPYSPEQQQQHRPPSVLERIQRPRLSIPSLLQRIPKMDVVYPYFSTAFAQFFPSLDAFDSKTIPEKMTSVVAIPAIFLLTLTVPVVDLAKDEEQDKLREIERDILLSRYSEENAAESPSRFFLEAVDKHVLGLYPPWCRWLLLLHCWTVPLFVVVGAGFASLISILVALGVSGALFALIFFFTHANERPRFYKLLCFAGFPTAVVWIYIIANEVVGLLRSLGLMLNISDAILGLTLFAVGNSFPDLVADVTVARLGFPNMAIAACFGGPMLNILLGIGVSSMYYTLSNQASYELQVTPTLITSACGLLASLMASLVLVPWYGFQGTRIYGVVLMGIYLTIMTLNILVELFHHR